MQGSPAAAGSSLHLPSSLNPQVVLAGRASGHLPASGGTTRAERTAICALGLRPRSCDRQRRCLCPRLLSCCRRSASTPRSPEQTVRGNSSPKLASLSSPVGRAQDGCTFGHARWLTFYPNDRLSDLVPWSPARAMRAITEIGAILRFARPRRGAYAWPVPSRDAERRQHRHRPDRRVRQSLKLSQKVSGFSCVLPSLQPPRRRAQAGRCPCKI